MKTIPNKGALIITIGFSLSFVYPVFAQDLAQDLAVATVGATMAVQSQSQGQALAAQAQALNKEQEQAQAQAIQPLPLPPVSSKPEPAPQASTPSDVGKSGGDSSPKTATTITSPSVSSPSAPSTTTTISNVGSSGIITSPPVLGVSKGKAGKEEASITVGKVPESVNGVVKRLNSETEDITLEDLNAAREAVAKLDILIDIEKRLSDLDTIRQERQEKTMANAIPASALGMHSAAAAPPPVIAPAPPQPFPTTPALPIFTSMTSSVEVDSIQGAGGRYVAYIKSGEGKSTQVRPGDKLPDGSVVQAITSQGVTLLKDKKKRTVKVKDVGTIFGAR